MRISFGAALDGALRGGASLIQLREKALPSAELLHFAQTAQELCRNYGAQLLINSDAGVAVAVGAGLHLPEGNAPPSRARLVLRRSALYGVSVHSVEAAQRAADAGAAYLIFGSVFETASHPGETPKGLTALQAVTNVVNCPVFAIGGVTAVNAKRCLEAGAHGVAVIGAVWNAPDVALAVEALLNILGET